MQLVADTLAVCSGCGDQEIQRLFAGVAGALGQHIIELAVGLSVKLVEHKAGHVQAVLGGDFRRKHLVEARVAVIHDALGRAHDLGAFQKCRGHLYHLFGDIEHNGSLLPVCRRAVHFCGRLIVRIEHIQGDRSGQL